MSTKIYNGYIIKCNDFKLLRKKLKALRDPFQEVINEHVKKQAYREVFHRLDRMALGLEKPKKVRDVCFDVKLHLNDEMTKSKTDPYRNFPYDVDAAVTIIPLPNITVGLFVHRLEGHLKLWDSLPWVKEYHYQNQTDRPKDITAKEWKLREKIWDVALPGAGVPSREGFTYEICDQQFPWGVAFWKDSFDGRLIRPVEERAAYHARNKIECDFMEKNKDKYSWKNGSGELWSAANRYCKEGAGKARVEKLAAKYATKLKPTYEIEPRETK